MYPFFDSLRQNTFLTPVPEPKERLETIQDPEAKDGLLLVLMEEIRLAS